MYSMLKICCVWICLSFSFFSFFLISETTNNSVFARTIETNVPPRPTKLDPCIIAKCPEGKKCCSSVDGKYYCIPDDLPCLMPDKLNVKGVLNILRAQGIKG